MLAALVPSYREGLEGALIIGITLAYLARISQGHRRADVWTGVFGAILVSFGFALVLFRSGAELEGRSEQIFEGVTLLLAAAVLTYMRVLVNESGER